MADLEPLKPVVFTGFIGLPIEVVVQGPDSVTAGDEFAYLVKVKDVDQQNNLNPRGLDWSTAVPFRITSMSKLNYQIAGNFDGDGYLECSIIGVASTTPGVYRDIFRGYNQAPGIYQDRPTDVFHSITVKPPA